MFEGGFISLDTSAKRAAYKSAAKLKSTWYKAEMDPCVGTSLYLEVALKGQQGVSGHVVSKKSVARRLGSLHLKRQHSTT